jgi:GH24 family phage-related lysozyme (muramidase)
VVRHNEFLTASTAGAFVPTAGVLRSRLFNRMGKTGIILLIAGVFVLALLPSMTAHASSTVYDVTDWLIPSFEGFRSTPYWDVTRYSWGYGTPAPGSTGTITEAQALAEMRTVVADNYNELFPLITRPLNPNQWGAYMSFAYNEGVGTSSKGAKALVNDINAGDDTVLEAHWKEYIYAGGVVNSDLVDRRNKEWAIWQS